MAKLKSLIKIEGTLDDLTFYKGTDGYLVRTKGGVSGDRIKNDPAFKRTRENGQEFADSAKAGKLLRRVLRPLLKDAQDSRVTSRLTQHMTRVKNADLTSERGKRNVATGLLTVDGKTQLRGFDFNNRAPLESVLLAEFTLNPTSGEVQIPSFIPAEDIAYPVSATHVSLRAAFVKVDFETRQHKAELSTLINLPIDLTVSNVVLTPAVPTGSGIQLYALYISFYQEVNGVQYPLNNGVFNALQLIEVV
ncbi:hypothetical protein BXY82_2715 [Gelidibacter sediminis]|uniref:Uncharacterized protein n=1 Tax=Gelidibacter sediminis TaxID=1608710 RepID=A0A4R7PJ27_9FLAO|nr:hypothetical protein [Gelidibacter sediminis]TDU34395.1 hypothetical protein BXY82_2715 [Gelidibacter sediminis]